MLPAAVLLIASSTYPLGLGIWLAFTDTTIGRAGNWVGLENFSTCSTDIVAQLALFNTCSTRSSRPSLKFALGPVAGAAAEQAPAVQVLLRAIMLLPWIVPTVLSAIAFWWIYDPQFSIISWVLIADGPDRPLHRLPRHPWPARCR